MKYGLLRVPTRPTRTVTPAFTSSLAWRFMVVLLATSSSATQRNWSTNVTILSGDIGVSGDDSDNSYHVIANDGVNATAVLDGVTITGGNANSDTERYGGGMYNRSSNPTLTNVTFTGNWASFGGGMGNDDNSNPTLTNVTFHGNQAKDSGGGMDNQSSNPMLTNVTFSGNLADSEGGGMNNWYSNLTLTNVTITGNQASNGGGMYNAKNGNPTLTNVILSGNQATHYGGGMYNWYSSPTLTNVTVSGNQGSDVGGMGNENNSHPTIQNSIIWGNSSQVSNDDTSMPTYTRTLVQDLDTEGFAGTENPAFVAAQPATNAPTTAGDYHLIATSPVIDAGTPGLNHTETDLDGNDRVFGDAIDLGPYEFQPVPNLISNGQRGRSGSLFVFDVTGFIPGQTVRVMVNGRHVLNLIIDAQGYAACGILFPVGSPNGDYIITFTKQATIAGLTEGTPQASGSASITVTIAADADLLTSDRSDISVVMGIAQIYLPLALR